MEYAEIEKLVKLVEKSSLTGFTYRNADEELILKKNTESVVVAPALMPTASNDKMQDVGETITDSENNANYIKVKSPYVGSISGELPKEGDKVIKGKVLCEIEAMKMINEIKSPANGTIMRVNVKDGECVEFDQVLFEIQEA